MQSLRFTPFWYAVGIALLIAGIVVALMPGSAVPVKYNDKLLHALGFVFFMVWFCGLVRPRHMVWVALSLLLYGLLMEYLQSLSPVRQAEGLDLVADSVGILLGWLLSLAGLRHWPATLESWLPTRNP